MKEIVMLGTGHAAVTECYNTCFAIREGDGFFLVDAGGGNGILPRLRSAGLDLRNIKGMFVTHAHTDHILGAVWILRMMDRLLKDGGMFTVWCHDEVKAALLWMAENLLGNGGKPFGWGGGCIRLRDVRDGERFSAMGIPFTVFDICSKKKKQFGFTADIDGRKLVCLGDEPWNPESHGDVMGADLLMSEAFCLDRDEAKLGAHKKSHSTAREAAATARSLGAKRLLLYHTEESDLPHRKENYTREAASVFPGEIFVPDDLESIEF